MDWTGLLESEIEAAYATTAKLLYKVDPASLEWKPTSGCNWMTVGQLLKHISNACGVGCKGFVTGDWGLPPAEILPTVESVEQAKILLSEDKAVALQMIDRAGEYGLANRTFVAPWAPAVLMPLGRHLLQMIQHLERHKSQLFYYLKLQGKLVDTTDLWV